MLSDLRPMLPLDEDRVCELSIVKSCVSAATSEDVLLDVVIPRCYEDLRHLTTAYDLLDLHIIEHALHYACESRAVLVPQITNAFECRIGAF